MNIAEILKNCPKGTKLYSPIYGEVKLICVNNTGTYPIVTDTDCDMYPLFSSDGKVNINFDGECMLFPSKNNRDWSTFKVHKKKNRKEHQFKPFEKILVKCNDYDCWKCDLFSHYTKNGLGITTVYNTFVRFYIPYKGNEHLVGTTNNPK